MNFRGESPLDVFKACDVRDLVRIPQGATKFKVGSYERLVHDKHVLFTSMFEDTENP